MEGGRKERQVLKRGLWLRERAKSEGAMEMLMGECGKRARGGASTAALAMVGLCGEQRRFLSSMQTLEPVTCTE